VKRLSSPGAFRDFFLCDLISVYYALYPQADRYPQSSSDAPPPPSAYLDPPHRNEVSTPAHFLYPTDSLFPPTFRFKISLLCTTSVTLPTWRVSSALRSHDALIELYLNLLLLSPRPCLHSPCSLSPPVTHDQVDPFPDGVTLTGQAFPSAPPSTALLTSTTSETQAHTLFPPFPGYFSSLTRSQSPPKL